MMNWGDTDALGTFRGWELIHMMPQDRVIQGPRGL